LVLHRTSTVDTEALLAAPGSSELPSMRPTALVALGVGIVFTWLFMYGMTPLLQGPIATAMGGVDLSWLAGGLAATASYVALEAVSGRRARP
jgi:NCS1 family nucleobase:cation symporter-1